MTTDSTRHALVTVDDYSLDGFSADFTIKTDNHCYDVAVTFSYSDGWDVEITDELGDSHDSEDFAALLGYDDAANLLTILTEDFTGRYESRFSLTVPAGV